MYDISYPAVSWLVHVTLNLACVRHKVLHSPVLQCCGVWGGEYGLYTEERQQRNTKPQQQLLLCFHMTGLEYLEYIRLIFLDLQFVHQVGAQVLSDVFMPGLPDPRRRERGGGGQVSHASHYWPIWHQLTIRQRERKLGLLIITDMVSLIIQCEHNL